MVDLLLGLLPVKKFLRNHLWISKFYHGVATYKTSCRKFGCKFFTQISEHAFFCICQGALSWSLWSGYHSKDLFLLQNLSIDYANFGQRRWCQKWKKGQPWSRPVTACKGINGSNRISRAFSKLNLKHQLSVLDFGGNETSWKAWQPETSSTASLAVDPYFGKYTPCYLLLQWYHSD